MLLYLDYDGVLHPDAVYLDARNQVYLRGYGTLFEHAALLEALLAPYPLLKIVLSTSWVRIKGFDRARRRLPQGLRERVIGATWHSRFMQDHQMLDWWVSQSSRYEQIRRDVERRQPGDWMALDDDERGWRPSEVRHLVACDPMRGLGEWRTREAFERRLAKRMVCDPGELREADGVDQNQINLPVEARHPRNSPWLHRQP